MESFQLGQPQTELACQCASKRPVSQVLGLAECASASYNPMRADLVLWGGAVCRINYQERHAPFLAYGK